MGRGWMYILTRDPGDPSENWPIRLTDPWVMSRWSIAYSEYQVCG